MLMVFAWLVVRGVAIGRELKALNDELVVLYGYKSLTWAFHAALITALVFFMVLSVVPRMTGCQIDISGKLICCTIIHVGLMTNWIAQLIYRRR
jgi:hypothetical protein